MSRFDEDRWRTRKDFSPLNLAIVRPIDFNILKKDKSKLSLKRNRLKASVNPISGRRCSLVNDSAFCPGGRGPMWTGRASFAKAGLLSDQPRRGAGSIAASMGV
jgi:hypothetical protein